MISLGAQRATLFAITRRNGRIQTVSGALHSCLCTEETLNSPEFLAWADRIRPAWDRSHTGAPVFPHRKIWEWVFIIQALAERGQLEDGCRGLGFGVGQDPLAALFASRGCQIVATDVGGVQAAGWITTNQHASSLEQLNQDGICEPSLFNRAVTFSEVDMQDIPESFRDFDFTWSACAFEHLGSLAAGQEFILRQMDCLRPGGYAIHTTEFNVSSNRGTLRTDHTVLYRKQDIDYLVNVLRSLGHEVNELDYGTGDSPADLHVDQPPWSGPHLKIQVGKYVATSMAIIIQKGPPGRTKHWRPNQRWLVHRLKEQLRFGMSAGVQSSVQQLSRLWKRLI